MSELDLESWVTQLLACFEQMVAVKALFVRMVPCANLPKYQRGIGRQKKLGPNLKPHLTNYTKLGVS